LPVNDLDLLISAARDAGVLALDHARRAPQITEKPDGAGPVTDADLAVNALFEERLRSARPDYGWLSEESPDDASRHARDRVFIIDPIDGTRSFIAGTRDWAHSIAVAEAGEVVAAVVYLPARDALYAAAKGQGAGLNGAPLAPGAASHPPHVLTAKPSLAPEHWHAGAPPPLERHFRSSLAWRLCLVAEGRFDAMLTLRPAWEWDIAAGALIVAEAGRQITDRRAKALRFNGVEPLLDGVVAGAGPVHHSLTQALA